MSETDFKQLDAGAESKEFWTDIARSTTRLVWPARGTPLTLHDSMDGAIYISGAELGADKPQQLLVYGMTGQYILDGIFRIGEEAVQSGVPSPDPVFRFEVATVWRLQRRQNFRVKPPSVAQAEVTLLEVGSRPTTKEQLRRYDLIDISTSGLSAEPTPGARGLAVAVGDLIRLRVSDAAGRRLEVAGQVLEGRPSSAAKGLIVVRFLDITPAQEQGLWLLCWTYLRQSDPRMK